MQKLQIFIGVALLVAIVAFLYTSRRGRQKTPATSGHPKTTGSRKLGTNKGRNTAALLAATVELRKKNAQWAEIMNELNPSRDSRMQEILSAIRGPHMFAPHTALGVIESGCRAVSPEAPAIAALQAAQKGMERVVRYGD